MQNSPYRMQKRSARASANKLGIMHSAFCIVLNLCALTGVITIKKTLLILILAQVRKFITYEKIKQILFTWFVCTYYVVVIRTREHRPNNGK